MANLTNSDGFNTGSRRHGYTSWWHQGKYLFDAQSDKNAVATICQDLNADHRVAPDEVRCAEGSDQIIESCTDQGRTVRHGESCLPNRRRFIIQTLGVTAVLFGVGANVKADAKTSHIRANPGDPTQDKWYFCHKCFGMFYNGGPQRGRCPAGGGHEAYGFNFVLPHSFVHLPNWQGDWHFCYKCFGMFYGGDRRGDKGQCPAKGEHDEYGLIFGLPYDVPETPGTQQQWRFCYKCFGMFYDGDQRGIKGRCPTGGGHEAYGFNFGLPHTAEFVQLPEQPRNPSISVSYNRSGPTFTVSGQDFLPNHVIHIRVVNNADPTNQSSFLTTSNSSGSINNFPISFPINFPQTYSFSANDERRDTSDRTGTLWSNTVTLTAT